ncbi:MAG: hypothetical protein HXY48_13180, partial [Ignavibacteriaceae bacterium]|nr:hypothetical protein [Ignavibacteriaceae bacterium]
MKINYEQSFPRKRESKKRLIVNRKARKWILAFESMTTKILLLIITIFSFNSLIAQNAEPNLHGYIQTRFTTDFDKTNDFMIRRAKLWVDGNAPGLENVSYKIQAVYRSFKDEAVMLQDAFAVVKFNGFGSLCVGRFVPDFMLQRMQPDYEIPVLERALVINGLIHSSKSMARQIGVQFTYQPNYLPIHFSFGVFNANLESPGMNKDQNLLYTSHAQVNLVKDKNTLLEIGASAAYRYANSITMNTIYDATQLITGNDYRFGFEFQMIYKSFGFQSEYVQANINKDRAWGYYGLATLYLISDLQLTGFIEKYSDLNLATTGNEWYGTGVNYYFTDKTKLMIDFRTQFTSEKNNYISQI